MVKYLDRDAWGNGFFEVTKELGYLLNGEKPNNTFAKRMQKECHEYWVNEKNKRLLSSSDQTGFFEQPEIEFLCEWAGKVYDKHNPKHVAAKNSIINTLGSKTVYWSQQLVERLDGFETFNWRMWSQKGWEETDEGKKRVAPRGKREKRRMEQLIPDEVSWLEIPFDEIPNYNWERLISETVNFIRENETLYDEIIQSVWNNTINISKLKNRLIKRKIPEDGLGEVPKRTFNFQGVEIDWEEQNRSLSGIGKIGEDLVIEYEKRKLSDAGFIDFANEVKKVKDGEGYDIFSRNLNGTQRKIEVKTTTGNSGIPFPITISEIVFSELNIDTYSLYRVFNLNQDNRVAEFHEYKGNLKQHFLLDGILFNAYRKKKK